MDAKKARRLRQPGLRRLSAYIVNRQQEQSARANRISTPSRAEGWAYPRRGDRPFDIPIRIASIPVLTTTTYEIFRQDDTVHGGVIRGYGYEFNQPHGYAQVRISLLVNGHTPTKFLFRTVDSTSGSYQGSFPPFPVASPSSPAETWIELDRGSVVSMRFQNNSSLYLFAAHVRLTGWFFGVD